MGTTREDLIRSGRWLEATDEEWQAQYDSVKTVVDRTMANDDWAVNIKKKVGVLLTSHYGNRPYLKGSVESHKKLGFWTVLAYDNFIDPAAPDIDYNQFIPPKDIMELVDTFLMSHHQTWGGVSYPYMWLLKLASGLMLHFDYVLCNNGDCILEKPEGFPKLLEAMGDADLMSTGPVLEREIGTAGLLIRSSALFKIANHLIDHVVPFEEYEKSTQEFGNTEGRIAVAVRELGLKIKEVEPPYNEQCHVPGVGFWAETVGFRHIHGEHNHAYKNKKIPPPVQYFDERFMGGEFAQIKAYWETQDIKILEDWWRKD